jgi:hypothetical protein
MSFDDRAPRQLAAQNRLGADSDVPSDLAFLAERLRNDALSLARCYPPPDPLRLEALGAMPATTSSEGRLNSRRWLLLSGACAAALAVAAVGWYAAARNGGRPDIVDRTDNSLGLSSRVAQLDDAEAASRRPADDIFGQTRNVLNGLSGAEQEAVLDLLESHTAPQTSLSI